MRHATSRIRAMLTHFQFRAAPNLRKNPQRMSPAVQNIFTEWAPPLLADSPLIVVTRHPLSPWLAESSRKTQPCCSLQVCASRRSFFAGLIILWFAIASPLDGFADVLLSAHMGEHLLLMSAVPPLLLLGLPVVPLLRGLPEIVRRYTADPLLRLSVLHTLAGWLVNPVVAWFVMNVSLLAWHIPAAYDFALQYPAWHVVEHLCFLSTSILFWWYILHPWPSAGAHR